jgi:hypothetical protein
MKNIASNETQSFDLKGSWISKEHCLITFHLNEDGMGDCEIDYPFDLYDLVFLRDVLTEFIDSCPKE